MIENPATPSTFALALCMLFAVPAHVVAEESRASEITVSEVIDAGSGLAKVTTERDTNAPSQQIPLATLLAGTAPGLNQQVLIHAIDAMDCAIRHGAGPASRLAVIDFSLPSSEQRLWLFDLESGTLLLQDFVAHGQGSGDNYPSTFSNVDGSHQSSLGLFRTSESYMGKHGYSLRMDGLEQGFNDKARSRAIVIHAADYVAESWIENQGRIGRSQGCPAVRPEVARMLVDNLKGGQFLFSYYPDQHWLGASTFLHCPATSEARQLALTE